MSEKAIRAIFATYESTWNRHDMDRWGELFTDDVHYVNRAGGIWYGNETNVREHVRIHETLRERGVPMDWRPPWRRSRF